MFFHEIRQDFTTLFQTLQMRTDFASASELIGSHLNDVQKMLVDHLLTIDDPELKQSLAQLPEESWGRLVTSPYLCEFLLLAKENRDPVEAHTIQQQIVRALVAEVRRVRPEFVHPVVTKWTINGDTVLDAQLRERFPSLQTNCGIGLNYQSDVHNTGKEGIGGYDYKTACQHRERIETAKALVGRVSLSAFSLIETFTTMIQFRQNLKRPNVVNSSTHTSIGLIRCDNFHKLHNDLPEIVDMLVHESIHQYLHLFEEQLFPFVRTEQVPSELLQERAFASPWSGNPLDLRSYTHAILVWYGLSHFWRQFLESGVEVEGLNSLQARKKLEEANYGFIHSSSVLDNLKSAKSYLQDEYARNVERIQRKLVYRNHSKGGGFCCSSSRGSR